MILSIIQQFLRRIVCRDRIPRSEHRCKSVLRYSRSPSTLLNEISPKPFYPQFRINSRAGFEHERVVIVHRYSSAVKESSREAGYSQQRDRHIGLFKCSRGVPRRWKILNILACKYWKTPNAGQAAPVGRRVQPCSGNRGNVYERSMSTHVIHFFHGSVSTLVLGMKRWRGG